MLRTHRRARTAASLLLTLGLGVGAAACGGDGDEEAGGESRFRLESTTTTAPAPVAGTEPSADGFCGAVLTVAAAEGPTVEEGPGLGGEPSGEDEGAADRAFLDGELRPAIDELRATAPPEVAADVEVLAGALEASLGGGEVPGGAPDRMDALAAQSRVVAATIDRCGWAAVRATATEYTYEGVPDTLPAGVTVFELTNGGEELHEMLVLRKADGVEGSIEEIVALPGDPIPTMTTFVAGIAFTGQGETAAALAHLTPGEYGVICTMSQGTTSLEAPDPERTPGPPHFTEGMVATFTVG